MISSVDPATLPRDCKLIAVLIEQLCVDADAQTVPMLYEFFYRYVSEILQDSLILSEHTEKKEINIECIRLAIDAKVSHSFTSPPDISTLSELAAKRNRVPLPITGEKFGLRLPPERHLLIRNNFTCDLGYKKTKVSSKFSSGMPPMQPMTPNAAPQIIQSRSHPIPIQPISVQPLQNTAPAVVETNEDDDYDM